MLGWPRKSVNGLWIEECARVPVRDGTDPARGACDGAAPGADLAEKPPPLRVEPAAGRGTAGRAVARFGTIGPKASRPGVRPASGFQPK